MAEIKTPLNTGIPSDPGDQSAIEAAITAAHTITDGKADDIKAVVDDIFDIVGPAKTLSAANDTVAQGFYAATTLSAVDTDLATANIKAGVTIFGIAGKTEVVDTTEAGNPAAAGDIALGKVAFVNGEKIIGTAE